jgi:hypothetical protein
MAKLTVKKRQSLPKADFALPGGSASRKKKGGGGSYPVEDKAHAKAALSRASQSGNSETIAKVRSKVAAKFPGLQKKGK